MAAVRLLFAGTSAPFALLPSLSAAAGGGDVYTLDAGTVWLLGRALASQCPAEVWVGLPIDGGELACSQPLALAGDSAALSPAATARLDLVPHRADTPAGPGQVGADLRKAQVAPPAKVSFTLGGGPVQLADAAATTVRLYGTELALDAPAGPAVWNRALGCVVLPFALPDGAAFDAGQPASPLLTLAGTAAVGGVGWAPAVSDAPVEQLGAARPPAWVLDVEAGLAATWIDEPDPVALGPLTLAAASDRLRVVASAAAGRLRRRRVAVGADGSLEWMLPELLALDHSVEPEAEALRLRVPFSLSVAAPVDGRGRRLPGRCDAGTLLLTVERADTGDRTRLRVTGTPDADERLPLALANALLHVAAPRRLSLLADLVDGQLADAEVTFHLPLLDLLPALPDPYASNVGLDRRRQWQAAKQRSGGDVTLTAVSTAAGTRLDVQLPATAAERLAVPNPPAAREAFARAMGSSHVPSVQHGPTLLDLSSNADRFGVMLAQRAAPAPRDRVEEDVGAHIARPPAERLVVEDLLLHTPADRMMVLTVPPVQWEALATLDQVPGEPPYPEHVSFADNGPPALLGVETVELVPVAPAPAFDRFVSAASGPDGAAGSAILGLPSGLLAGVRVGDRGRGASIAPVRPAFPLRDLTGGRQLSLTPPADPGARTTAEGGMPGVALQTDARGPGGEVSPLGPDVGMIFNLSFATGPQRLVPVTRVDLSGYGESGFSDWRNPTDDPVAVAQVRLGTLVGRTSHEVVQVRSILYPYGVRVVRTITIQRQSGGLVVRHDSGWQAASAGRYLFPPPGLTVHPGVVRGIDAVTHVRDTGARWSHTPPGGVALTFAAVRFDGQLQVDGAAEGAGPDGVPVRDHVGFVQLTPSSYGLLDADGLLALLDANGPLAGAVDCVVALGAPGQRMRLTQVGMGATGGPGAQEFAMVAHGSPLLPAGGEWSFAVRRGVDPPQPVDRDAGVPLVRVGAAPVGPAPSAAYLFSDPADLQRLDHPTADYGLLHATGTQRILFRRPRVEVAAGEQQITSDLPPLLADPYVLTVSEGVPVIERAIAFPDTGWALHVDAQGHLRLDAANAFPVPQAATQIVDAHSVRATATYRGRPDAPQPSIVDVAIDTAAPTPWHVRISNLGLTSSSALFGDLLGVVGDLDATAGALPVLRRTRPVMFGPLGEIAKFFSGLLGVDMPHDQPLSVRNDWGFEWDLVIDIHHATESPPAEQALVQAMEENPAVELKDLSLTVKNKVDHTGEHEADFEVKVGVEVKEPPFAGVGEAVVTLQVSTANGTDVVFELDLGAGIDVAIGRLGRASGFLYSEAFAVVGDVIGVGWGNKIEVEVDLGIAKFDLDAELKGAFLKTTCTAGQSWWSVFEGTVSVDITLCWILTIHGEYSTSGAVRTGGPCTDAPDMP